MKICVCGWYGNQYGLYDTLAKQKTYDVYVVCHSDFKVMFPYVVIDNIGLEWGAYDYYIRHIWDGRSNVLFIHDDIRIDDVKGTLHQAARLNDCTFIFGTRDEQKDNGGRSEKYDNKGLHGRAFFVSSEALSKLGGFWFDKENTGWTIGKSLHGKYGCNEGIQRFYQRLKDLNITVHNAIIPGFHNGRRGKII